jgi:hypothetical protein
VENTDDEKVKKIKILLARNHPPCEFYVRWDWETGEFEELPDDYFEDLETRTTTTSTGPVLMSGGWNHVLRANPVPGDVVCGLLEMGVDVFKVDRDEAQAPCPAHYERTGKERSRGDWSVNTDDGMHNCFSCGFSGYFVDVVQHVLSISREEAVHWTRARGGIERVRNVPRVGLQLRERRGAGG